MFCVPLWESVPQSEFRNLTAEGSRRHSCGRDWVTKCHSLNY